jgi:hypothetical protein
MLENIVSFIINRPFQCAAYSGIAGLIIYNLSKCPYKKLLASNQEEMISNHEITISNQEETISNQEITISNPLPKRFYEQIKNKYDYVILNSQPLRKKMQNYYSNIINYNTNLLQPIIVGFVVAGLVYNYCGNLINVPNNLAEIIKKIITKSRNNLWSAGRSPQSDHFERIFNRNIGLINGNNCIRNNYLLK